MGFRICFFTVGDENFASSRARIFQYFPYLHEAGVKTTIMTDNRSYRGKSMLRPLAVRWHRFFQRLMFVLAAPFHDIVFVQKIIFPRWYINLLTRLNPRLAFDLDDAIYTNSGAEEIDTGPLDYLLSKTKAVFAENEDVVTYVSKHASNVVSILGPIDCRRYRPRAPRPHAGPVVIGWVGSPSTEKYLFQIRDAFLTLKPEDYRFVCIGVRPTFASKWGLPVEVRTWSLDTEVALLEEFDLGIMPLPDDRWSRGKGGYKLLQYMAMGIPSITSPIGVNIELIEEHQTGCQAVTNEEWAKAFKVLMASDTERARLGAVARKRAEDRYSFEHHFPLFLATLEECLQTGR